MRVFIELFNSEGESLETKTMDLPPWSNNQITRVFRNYSPISAGYVDVWTNTAGRVHLLLRLGARQPDLGPDHRAAAVTFGSRSSP